MDLLTPARPKSAAGQGHAELLRLPLGQPPFSSEGCGGGLLGVGDRCVLNPQDLHGQ